MRFSHLAGLAALSATTTTALDTLINLGYAQYQGQTLANGVNQYLGLRFAAPSIPPRRFAAAQPPLPETTVQDATKEGPICVSANNPEGLQFDSPRQFMAEDCLFAAVYAPANATTTSMLPIMMFVSGGGFSSNSNANFNGTGLVEASGMNMIVMRANYRVGMLGFLAGTMVEADTKGAVSNNGLKDIAAAAQWMKDHATSFGGNPNHIVITGASSGGHAIDALLQANNGVGFPDLFVGAIAESTGWGSEPQTVDRDEALMNNLKATGCDTKPDPLDCLRNLPIGELQARSTTDGWGPTIDGKFMVAPHFQMYEQGRFQSQIPVIYGYASDEGTPDFIANQTVNTTEEVAADVRSDVGQSMSDAEVQMVMAAYPESLTNTSIFGRNMAPRNASLRQGSGAQWQRDAAIETELKLHCVGAFFNDMFATAGQTKNYAYRYNILDETPGGNADKGLFSPHTSELYSVWGANNTDGGDPGCLKLPAADPLSCATGAAITQSYWISFVRTLDPNALRAANAPEWLPWTVTNPNRMLLDNAGASMEQMGQAVGEVPLNGMNQRQRCLSFMLGFMKRINQGLGANETLPVFANGTKTDPTLALLQGAPAAAGVAVPAPAAAPSSAPANTNNGQPAVPVPVTGGETSNPASGGGVAAGLATPSGAPAVASNGSAGGRPLVTVSSASGYASSMKALVGMVLGAAFAFV